MSIFKPFWTGLAALSLTAAAQATSVMPAAPYSEGFDNLASSGWLLQNNSSPVGQDWYQGVPEVLNSQAGAAEAFVMATYLSANNGTGSIDNWLISPEISLGGATTLSFYARSANTAGFADAFKVLFSAGPGSSTGSFTSLVSITAEISGWTQYTLNLPSAASGRIAFEYRVADAGNANSLAIDTVNVTSAVPEPSSFALLGLGLLVMAARRGRATDSV